MREKIKRFLLYLFTLTLILTIIGFVLIIVTAFIGKDFQNYLLTIEIIIIIFLLLLAEIINYLK